MSGPKVVRVITKKERISACLARMEALREAIDEWCKVAKRHDALTQQSKDQTEATLRDVTRKYEQERYGDAQNQCTSAIAFLRNDIARIRNEAIAKAEQERSLRRRLQFSSTTLIRAFKESGRPIPEELELIATAALNANEAELILMQSTVSSISKEYTLSTIDNTHITPLQKALLENLAADEKTETFAQWQSSQNRPKLNEAERRLDKLLAEIEAIEDTSTTQPFLDRVAKIAQEPASNLRSLLTDSLILDLTLHNKAKKEKENTIISMKEVLPELRQLTSTTAQDLVRLLTKAINAEDTITGSTIKNRALALIKSETQALAGIARREAILKGLSELGYEVKETMTTAWAQNGRLVVKKPNDTSYGVELAAVADAERMQVQLVALGNSKKPRDTTKDRDRETIWCSEFTQLQELVGKAGTAIDIERALPIGVKPLKVIEVLDPIKNEQGDAARPTMRKSL